MSVLEVVCGLGLASVLPQTFFLQVRGRIWSASVLLSRLLCSSCSCTGTPWPLRVREPFRGPCPFVPHDHHVQTQRRTVGSCAGKAYGKSVVDKKTVWPYTERDQSN